MVRMQWIGLTGGIAAGKSAVAARLAELGAVVIDADAIARLVVEPGEPALAAIAETFGAGVLDGSGRLDRPALAAIVFADPAARAALESITHPAIAQRVRRMRAEALERNPDAVIVYDVPLLAEGGRAEGFDLVVVVHADVEARIRRMVELRGMDPAQARRRVAAQASDEDRLAIADVVIDANGTLAHTLEQTDALWLRLTSQSAQQRGEQ